jgi:dTDP-glucose 4,6-dehydratase
MRRLLVTGGAGFIGVNFVNYWLRHYPEDFVCVLDRLTYAGYQISLEPIKNNENFLFVHEDIRDQELVEDLLRKENIDLLVHFAAESHVDRSIVGPDAFIDTNIIGTHSLLKAARKVWLEHPDGMRSHHFHHVSTDEVYGTLGPNAPAFSEKTPYFPRSPYAASKASSDHLVRAYHHTYGLNVTISNCSNNYGPYQFPEKLIPLTIINILQGKSLPIYGDGLNIRDWLYVDDHCLGIDLILKRGKIGETYNIGSNNERTNIDVVEWLCQSIDYIFEKHPELVKRFPKAEAAYKQSSASLIKFIKDRPGHDRRYAINAGKIKKELGFTPRETFVSGMQKTIRWYLENEAWWCAVTSGSYIEWIREQYG